MVIDEGKWYLLQVTVSVKKFPADARQRHDISRIEQFVSGEFSTQSTMQEGKDEIS